MDIHYCQNREDNYKFVDIKIAIVVLSSLKAVIAKVLKLLISKGIVDFFHQV
jgi:hypothetical protein